MGLTASIPRIEEHRVSVVFDCPKCGSKVRGMAYDLRETIRISDRVPRWGWQSHWVRCPQCNAEHKATCAAAELTNASPTKVNEHIKPYLPFTGRFISIASVALSWTPIVGIVLGIIAMVATSRSRGWPRWVSFTGLILALTINAAMLWALFNNEAVTASPLVFK